MLKWFPIIRGYFFTCQQYFVIVTVLIYVLVYAIIFGLKMAICIYQCRQSKIKYKTVVDEVSDQVFSINVHQDSEDKGSPIYTKKQQPWIYGILEDFQNLNIASIPAILSMFSYLSAIYSLILGGIILLFLVKFRKNFRNVLLLIGLLLFYALGENLCLSFHNELDRGLKVQGNFVTISSTFIRWLMIEQRIFVDQEPHIIYTTLPHNASYQAFFNFHTHRNNMDAYVYAFSHETKDCVTFQKTDVFEIDYLDSLGNRNVHTALLSNLQPSQVYEIFLSYQQIDSEILEYNITKEQSFGPYIYRSLGQQQEKIVMINGGDLGNTHIASQTWKALAKEPQIDVFQIGGDISYDNGMPFCYNCWDLFFEEYTQFCRAHNKLIPLILTVGNHDVGVVESPKLIFPWSQGLNVRTPLYFVYFPQHLDQRGRISEVSDRRTNFNQMFDGFIVINLDTEQKIIQILSYVESSRSQSKSLLDQFEECNQTDCGARIVSYHYPVLKLSATWSNIKRSKERIQNFNQHFRSNQVNFVFENHEHTRKRTRPLDFKMNQDMTVFDPIKVDNGPIYLGNGGLGVNQCSDQNDYYFNSTVFDMNGCSSHYWVTILHPKNRTMSTQAQSGNGTLLDFVQIQY